MSEKKSKAQRARQQVNGNCTTARPHDQPKAAVDAWAKGAGGANNKEEWQRNSPSRETRSRACMMHGAGAVSTPSQGGSFGFGKQDAITEVAESSAILVWPPVALIDTLVSERRFGSPSSSPPRLPVAGSSRTVLLIAVPPSCRLFFRPLCFQAP